MNIIRQIFQLKNLNIRRDYPLGRLNFQSGRLHNLPYHYIKSKFYHLEYQNASRNQIPVYAQNNPDAQLQIVGMEVISCSFNYFSLNVQGEESRVQREKGFGVFAQT